MRLFSTGKYIHCIFMFATCIRLVKDPAPYHTSHSHSPAYKETYNDGSCQGSGIIIVSQFTFHVVSLDYF